VKEGGEGKGEEGLGLGFSLKRIWQAYAFEHPQFWQRIDAPGKHIAREIYNTIPVATLRILRFLHAGNVMFY